MNWKRYEVNCLNGTQTNATYIVEVWAISVRDAYDQVQALGYTPLSLRTMERAAYPAATALATNQ